MTTEQTESYNRIRATWASNNDSEAINGTYATKDIESILFLLEEQKDVLSCVKEDLEWLRRDLVSNGSVGHLEMVESTLGLLEDI